MAELKQDLHLDDIQVESQQAMLAVVGRAMRQMPGMSGKILSTLGDQQINIRTINQACDEQSMSLGSTTRTWFRQSRRFISSLLVKKEWNDK